MGRKVKNDGAYTDRVVKSCTKCRKCWELTAPSNYRGKPRAIIFYEQFPRYGKKKETCPKCNNIPGKYTSMAGIPIYKLDKVKA